MLDRVLWQSPQSLPAVFVGGVIIILAVTWLYRSQLRMLTAPWTWVVPGLRLAALGVLICAFVKPVVVRQRNPWEQGAVVVLIDRSRSMSVVDAQSSSAQRVALADALGFLPAGMRSVVSKDLLARSESLPPMVDAIATARSELEYTQLSGRGTAEAQSRLRDATAAFATAANSLRGAAASQANVAPFLQACDELIAEVTSDAKRRGDWIPRLRQRVAAVVDAAQQFQNTADAELYKNSDDTRKAADRVGTQSRLALVDRAIGDSTAGMVSDLPARTPVLAFGADATLPAIALSAAATTQSEANGPESDLNGAIAAVRQKLAGQPIQAVVLFSDGRQIGGSSAAPALDVPLFTIGAAGAVSKDIAIARFQVPSSMFVGETVAARIELSSMGLKDQPVDVTLTTQNSDAQGNPLQEISQTQHVVVNDGRTPVTFPIKADVAGMVRISAAIAGVPADVTCANGQSERRIKVLTDKVAVAVIGGSAGWDYQYLRNALLRTPWVRCSDEIAPKDASGLRMSPQQILSQQVVILDDVDPSALKPDQWDAINKLVTERGGGVIVVAGDDVPPARLGTQPVLADLLPWPVDHPPVWRTWAGEAPGYRLMPPEGESADVIKLSNDPEENRRRWTQLPAIYRILPISFPKPNVRVLLVESESNQPVLTEARVGVGRAMFLGANETWRWRFKIGERDQDRFWLQLIREAGEAPYAYHDGAMSLDVDRIRPMPNQPVHVRARMLDEQGRPAEGMSPAVQVEHNGTAIMTVPLRPATPGINTGRYAADLSGLENGDYELRLMTGTGTTKLSAPLHVEPNYEAEMADVSGDDDNLRRLAQASGGEFLRLDQIRTLPEKLAAARERRPQSTQYPLWDSPYLFLFVLGCLGGEWAMRKQFGLV